MFEDENEQNGNQANDQSARFGIARPGALDDTTMADQISSGEMFTTPQSSGGAGGGDFVNRNLLRINPQTGAAYRPRTTSADSGALSPSARQLGESAADSGKAVRDPVTVLQEQQAEYGKPIPIRDAQGKMNPKYRMGIGQRILASVANFANGFAGNKLRPTYVGPGALNNRYYQDEALRQQNLANVNRQLLQQAPAQYPSKGGAYDGVQTDPGQALQDSGQTTQVEEQEESGLLTPRSQTTPRQRLAQARAAKLSARLTPPHRAYNPQTGQYAVSNDGTHWRLENDASSKLA